MTAPFSRAVYKRWLAVTMRNLRGETTLQAAADALGCSPGRIRHFESGRNVPHAADIQGLMQLYSATERTDELVNLATQIREAPPEQDLSRLANTPDGFDTFLGLEQGARELTEWAAMTVPGLLQTQQYATAVMAGHQAGLANREVQRRVSLRMRRQDVLRRSNDPPTITGILDEAVLRRQVGGAAVLQGQLEQLVTVSGLPNVSVRVIPYDRVVPGALHGSFTALDFGIPGDDGLIYLEDRTGGTAIEDPDAIDDYGSLVEELLATALSDEESRMLITQIGEEL